MMMGIPLLDLQNEVQGGRLMGQKHLPPEPPPCHGVQKIRTHDILNAGRSQLAAVRLAMPVRRIQPTMTADRPGAGHGPSEPRGPPDHGGADQTWIGPMGGSTGPNRPARRKGSHVRSRKSITSQA